MSTAIEWCHIPGYVPRTWNPVVGCTSNGTGCDLCYARTSHNMRHKAYKEGKLQQYPQYAVPFSHVQLKPERIPLPLKTKLPTCWFVNSVSDLFHEEVPTAFIAKVFASMRLKSKDIFIILTKRPERMSELTNSPLFWKAVLLEALALLPKDEQHLGLMLIDPLPNVWMGASASTQAEVDHAVPQVLKTNAAVRLMSLEPLVEAVTLRTITYPRLYGTGLLDALTGQQRGHVPNSPWGFIGAKLDWVIVGGESGSTKQKPRAMHPDWARGVRDECRAAGVDFFFKQWGAWMPINEPWKEDDIRPLGKNERWLNAEGGHGFHGQNVWRMARKSKHAAGCLLDGKVEHAWPINEL